MLQFFTVREDSAVDAFKRRGEGEGLESALLEAELFNTLQVRVWLEDDFAQLIALVERMIS